MANFSSQAYEPFKGNLIIFNYAKPLINILISMRKVSKLIVPTYKTWHYPPKPQKF